MSLSVRDRLLQILDTAPGPEVAMHVPFFADHTSAPTLYADGTGTITWANRACRQFYGYSFAEMVGQPFTMISPQRHKDLHEAMIARLRDNEMARDADPIRVTDMSVETSVITSGGEERPVLLHVSAYKHNGSSLTFTLSVETPRDGRP